jgi:hypothetical protein
LSVVSHPSDLPSITSFVGLHNVLRLGVGASGDSLQVLDNPGISDLHGLGGVAGKVQGAIKICGNRQLQVNKHASTH